MMRIIFLNCNECIGHQAGLLHSSVLDYERNAICSVLAGDFLINDRILIKTGKRIQITIQH